MYFFSSFRGSLVCMKITNPISIQTRWNPKTTSARPHLRITYVASSPAPRRQNLKSRIFPRWIPGLGRCIPWNAADYLWRIAPRFRSIPAGNERMVSTGGITRLLARPPAKSCRDFAILSAEAFETRTRVFFFFFFSGMLQRWYAK